MELGGDLAKQNNGQWGDTKMSAIRGSLTAFISSVFDDLEGKVVGLALESHDGSRHELEGRVSSRGLDHPHVQTRNGEIFPVGSTYAFIEFLP